MRIERRRPSATMNGFGGELESAEKIILSNKPHLERIAIAIETLETAVLQADGVGDTVFSKSEMRESERSVDRGNIRRRLASGDNIERKVETMPLENRIRLRVCGWNGDAEAERMGDG